MAIECYRQGDVCFQKLDKLPEGLVEKGTILEIHGEEGHVHLMDGIQTFMPPRQEGQLPVIIGQLPVIIVTGTASMVHEQHPTLILPEGIFRTTQFQEHENPQRVD